MNMYNIEINVGLSYSNNAKKNKGNSCNYTFNFIIRDVKPIYD